MATAAAHRAASNYHDLGVKVLEHQRALSRTTRPQRDTARAFGPKIAQPKPARNCR
jgi:cytochrome c peroxidase